MNILKIKYVIKEILYRSVLDFGNGEGENI